MLRNRGCVNNRGVESGTITRGSGELRRRAEELAARLPDELAPFARLALNYRWSWLPGGPELFAALDPERFQFVLQNPVRLLQELSAPAIERACADGALLARAAELEALVQADLERPFDGRIDASRPVAFLCAEYGVHVSLPVYSGGLGALAGDLLKEASDSAIPLVAVGLMYRKGYFRQRIDAGGWQHEYWIDTDPDRLPAACVRDEQGDPLTVCVPIYGNEVSARIWRVDVGRIPLFLLDTDVPENRPHDRWITARLYESDSHTRLAQYVLLGAGGVRALRALGIEPGVVHMNEGHPALAPVELAGAAVRSGSGLEAALAEARSRTVFTTHTPVPAGNDTYPADQVEDAVATLLEQLSMPQAEWLALGRTNPGDPHEPFGVTQAALRMSRAANAVSRRHGEVAREMWNVLWPERATGEVPIAHVTNGVHIPTWVGAPMRALLDRYLGEDWMARAADPQTWAGVEDIPDRELWEVRRAQRGALVDYIARRSVNDRLLRGDVYEYVDAAARVFDPDTLTLGFARRVATYKRLDLLTRDPEFTFHLLSGEQPVQVVLAGKAHPRDEEAKRSLQRIFGLKYARVIAERVVFLDDYDLASAALLVRGCDVWMNLPRPPLEASGTSGMKSVMNGGLQLSVLDGWWAEGFDENNGWGLPGDVDHDHHAQDERHFAAFKSALADEVLPLFYSRGADGVPGGWLARVKASLRTLGPQFSATRMLDEYVDGPYRG
jgi:starch phosphorylase